MQLLQIKNDRGIGGFSYIGNPGITPNRENAQALFEDEATIVAFALNNMGVETNMIPYADK